MTSLLNKILKVSELIRQKYSYIIVATLILSIIIGFYTTSPGITLRKFTTIFVIVMIASMGFTITFKSFGLALRDLKGFSFGMFLNFVLSPILCYLISLIIPEPKIAVGLILIGAVPCAGMAIVWAGLLDGDVPLAVVINTATMVLAPFLIPFIMAWLAGSYVKINTTAMLLNLIYRILLPVLAGMTVRELCERVWDVKKILPLCPAIAALCAVFLMFIAVNTSVVIVMKNIETLPYLVISAIVIFPTLFAFAITSFGPITALPIAVSFAFQMLTAVGFYRIFKGGGVGV